MGSFTRVDNWLFDEVMPAAKPNTYKVVCAVVRMTAGWRRGRAEMSFSDLHELTGITGRSTLADAVADAIARGWICREASGKSFTYAIGTEIVPMGDDQYGNRTDDQYENRTDDGTEIVPPSIDKRKEKKLLCNTPTPEGLMKLFEQATGLTPPHDTTTFYSDDWQTPFEQIIRFDPAHAAERVTAAIEIMRGNNDKGRRYTIKNPRSLLTTALNWQSARASPNGQHKRVHPDVDERPERVGGVF